ncbi:MAG: cytochrome C oxidase subunit IV family protein [Colwellia sp.]|nr:cytochrome C oxidase subunit IV family protein [Colwellia sp.]
MNNIEQQSEQAKHQPPIAMYLKVWLLLFILSTFSYMVDYFNFQGALRWGLILLFMFLKAGFIISIFMHVTWERLTLKMILFLPLFAVIVFIALMFIEGDYIFTNRNITTVING